MLRHTGTRHGSTPARELRLSLANTDAAQKAAVSALSSTLSSLGSAMNAVKRYEGADVMSDLQKASKLIQSAMMTINAVASND